MLTNKVISKRFNEIPIFRKIIDRPDLFITLLSWINRAVSAIVGILTSRIALHNLGEEKYGILTILISISAWLTLLDIGFGYTIQNAVSKRIALERPIARLISFAKQISLLVVIVGLILALSLSGFLNELIFGRKLVLDNCHWDVSIFITILCGSLVVSLNILAKVALALRRGSFVYGAQITGSLASLAALLLVSASEYSSSVSINLITIQTIPAVCLVAIWRRLPKSHGVNGLQCLLWLSVWRRARAFWLFALLSAIVLQCDYIIISQLLNYSDATKYNLVSKVMGLYAGFYSAGLAALWPTIAERVVQCKYTALWSTVRRMLIMGLAGGVVVSLVLIYGKDIIFHGIFGTKLNQVPDMTLVASVAIYWLLRIWTDTFAVILQAAGAVRELIIAVPLQALVSIIMQYVLTKYIGISGIAIGLSIGFATTVAWILPLSTLRVTMAEGRS